MKQSVEQSNEVTWEQLLEAERRAFAKAGISVQSTRGVPNKNGGTKEVIFIKRKDPPEPTLDEIIKEYPPVDEEINMDYGDEDEEEELDLVSSLLPFEERFYDDEGRFYPDGYVDEEGNILGNEPEKEDE